MDRLIEALGNLAADVISAIRRGIDPEEIARAIEDPGGARARLKKILDDLQDDIDNARERIKNNDD